jgi:hypothetical protein
MAAADELSTPPLIATAILVPLIDMPEIPSKNPFTGFWLSH